MSVLPDLQGVYLTSIGDAIWWWPATLVIYDNVKRGFSQLNSNVDYMSYRSR